MPHIELSLTGEHDDDSDPDTAERSGPGGDRSAADGSSPSGRRPPRLGGSAPRWWAEAVTGATEPAVVLDSDGVVVAHSSTCRALFGAAPDDEWIGRGLLDVLKLVDLTPAAAPLASWEGERVPPLLALATRGLARSVMRVRGTHDTHTVDAIATPLWDGAAVVGSLTFFCRIQTSASSKMGRPASGWFSDSRSSA
ncbi:MAG: hypothetical protein ACRDT8_01685 [Micromonosporaceae bacterium]